MMEAVETGDRDAPARGARRPAAPGDVPRPDRAGGPAGARSASTRSPPASSRSWSAGTRTSSAPPRRGRRRPTPTRSPPPGRSSRRPRSGRTGLTRASPPRCPPLARGAKMLGRLERAGLLDDAALAAAAAGRPVGAGAAGVCSAGRSAGGRGRREQPAERAHEADGGRDRSGRRRPGRPAEARHDRLKRFQSFRLSRRSCCSIMSSHHPPDGPVPGGRRTKGRAFVRIALIGTRGVPARYGGFETAVEEVGSRLAGRGHDVTVYCRSEDRSPEYLGMRRVVPPGAAARSAETLSHTALSVAHQVRHRADVAVVFNAANAPLVPALHALGVPVAVHVDGLEWQRGKWGRLGRRYYLFAERAAVRWADALIADAVGIQDYYRRRYGAASHFLAYGAPSSSAPPCTGCPQLGLRAAGLPPRRRPVRAGEPRRPRPARLRREQRAAAARRRRLGAVRERRTSRSSSASAATDDRVRMLGSVWDQELLDALYAGAASYLHGHSVGGTNPSLLRALGAGASVVAFDVDFNREVIGEAGRLLRRGRRRDDDPQAGRGRPRGGPRPRQAGPLLGRRAVPVGRRRRRLRGALRAPRRHARRAPHRGVTPFSQSVTARGKPSRLASARPTHRYRSAPGACVGRTEGRGG